MSAIRCIYLQEPSFPATEQHPDAVRYQIGARWVDAVGGAPTQAELDAVLGVDAPSLADRTRLATIDDNIRTTTIGTVAPLKTVADLKAMDWPAYSAWFDTNFDTAAKVVGFVKRLGLVMIRRVL